MKRYGNLFSKICTMDNMRLAIVVLGSNKEQLKLAYQKILQKINELNLSLKPNWLIFPVESRSVDFLGFKIKHDYVLVRNKTKYNFIKKLIRCASLKKLQIICGCYWGIFCHANCTNLWRTYLGYDNHKQMKVLFKAL